MDRLSYSYLMDDMVRGHLLTMEVILKPKVTLVSARSAQLRARRAVRTFPSSARARPPARPLNLLAWPLTPPPFVLMRRA
jgi:hypothetical protein